jgi:hypothetical protein
MDGSLFLTGKKPLLIYTWESEQIAPGKLIVAADEVPLRDLAIEQVSDLRFDLSLDPVWRRTLFNAKPFERFELPTDYSALTDQVREYGLRFAVFNDGWTECGFVVFGIESIDFPEVVMYTTNNPAII